jgi:hypothetical protein
LLLAAGTRPPHFGDEQLGSVCYIVFFSFPFHAINGLLKWNAGLQAIESAVAPSDSLWCRSMPTTSLHNRVESRVVRKVFFTKILNTIKIQKHLMQARNVKKGELDDALKAAALPSFNKSKAPMCCKIVGMIHLTKIIKKPKICMLKAN